MSKDEIEGEQKPMTQKPKLSAGDRVRVYDKTKFNWPVFGVVKEVSPCFIVEGTWGEEQFYPQQCRKLRPKQKPEKERERKTWHVGSFSQTEDGSTTGTLFPNGHVRPPWFGTDLVAIEPGQVVLGREELARAWDETFPLMGMELQFQALLLALGLGKDKA